MSALKIDVTDRVWLKVQKWIGKADGADLPQPDLPVDALTLFAIHA
jgi:hypothetical protein